MCLVRSVQATLESVGLAWRRTWLTVRTGREEYDARGEAYSAMYILQLLKCIDIVEIPFFS
jgi:hypothetical protein